MHAVNATEIHLPFDALTERYLVSAIVANPAVLSDQQAGGVWSIDLHVPLARGVRTAVRNLEAAGLAVSRAAVIDLMRGERAMKMDVKPDHWIASSDEGIVESLLEVAEQTPPALAAVHRMIKRVRRDAEARARIVETVLAAAAEEDQVDAELDAAALEEVADLQPTLPRESVPINGKHPTPPHAPPIPKSRWIVSLESFLGDEEPSDDDAEDWLIRDVVPRGEAALLAGPPKCGKTWLMLSLGLDVAMGRTWLDKFENTFGRPA